MAEQNVIINNQKNMLAAINTVCQMKTCPVQPIGVFMAVISVVSANWIIAPQRKGFSLLEGACSTCKS